MFGAGLRPSFLQSYLCDVTHVKAPLGSFIAEEHLLELKVFVYEVFSESYSPLKIY